MVLLLGYAAAATRQKNQLKDMPIPIDEGHPLFVYLHAVSAAVPVVSNMDSSWPSRMMFIVFLQSRRIHHAMTPGLMTGLHDKVSAQEIWNR